MKCDHFKGPVLKRLSIIHPKVFVDLQLRAYLALCLLPSSKTLAFRLLPSVQLARCFQPPAKFFTFETFSEGNQTITGLGILLTEPSFGTQFFEK